MQTSPNESDSWQLFKSVRPLFASDIPWKVQYDSRDDVAAEISIENTGDLIKACMLEIPVYIRMEHFENLDGFALFIANDLRPFLFTLQELVHDMIMEYVDISTVRPADPEFLKLNALGYMLQSSTTNTFHIEEYWGFLYLNQDPDHLRKALTGIEKINKRLMAEMSKNASDRSAVPKPKTTIRSTSNSPVSWLQTTFNPSFWSSSQTLFKALVRNLGSCNSSTHSAMLSLKGLKPPKPQDEQAEFDILLPLCPKDGSWQETTCHVLDKRPSGSDAVDDVLRGNVCQAVQTANDLSFMLCIHIHEESMRCYCVDQQPTHPKALPTMAVSQLIECGFLKDLRGFQLKDRWILALNLAQSLLQLHNGPWLQTLWTSERLFFLSENLSEGRKLCNIHKPFISCIISNNPPKLPRPSHFDKYPLLLTFGQFLLELANGEKLPITRTKSGEFSPYKTLMDNFKEVNTGSLSDYYKEAIEGCLNFHKFVKDEKDPEEEIRVRTTIFKRIVQPLERNLRLFSKDPVPLKHDILLAPQQVSGLPLLRPHPPALGRSGGGQVKSLERNNYQAPVLEFSNPHPPCVSLLEKDLCWTGTVTGKHIQPLGVDAKAVIWQDATTLAKSSLQPHFQQTEKYNTSSSSESEAESDETGGRLLGTFDTEDSEMQVSASLEWGKTLKNLSQIYNKHFQHRFSDEPVKVAILDTGIDRSHPDFQHARSKRKSEIIQPVKNEEEQIKRIKACRNFCDDRKDLEDVTDMDGHGTHIAGIILQFAPNADVYIARVCQGDESYGRSSFPPKADMPNEQLKSADAKKVHPGRVERAIEWAIGHRVHLVNMSFGYKKYDPQLDQVLRKARDHGIVIFAAASNFGNHEKVAWPARDAERAICVHSSNDFGTDCSKFTPKAHPNTINFMVVGETVCSHWPVSKGGGFRTMSGTSTATPVATAVAALLLAFTRQDVVDKEKKKDVEDEIGPVILQELWAMRALLKHICTKVDNYYWIQPSLLWWNYEPTTKQGKDPRVATNHAWEEIRKALQR